VRFPAPSAMAARSSWFSRAVEFANSLVCVTWLRLLFAVYCMQWLQHFEIGPEELHSNDSTNLPRNEGQI
jgi:hypothetical protein